MDSHCKGGMVLDSDRIVMSHANITQGKDYGIMTLST